MRASLARLIDHSPGFNCLSQHPNAEHAIQELPRAKPAVVLMDINLPGLSGVECVRRLKPALPGTQIIMLTVYQNTEHIFNALAAGATGTSTVSPLATPLSSKSMLIAPTIAVGSAATSLAAE